MNTGFLGPAVATVLTACGIETRGICKTQGKHFYVATVLTACGIETDTSFLAIVAQNWVQQYLPLAVLKLWIY